MTAPSGGLDPHLHVDALSILDAWLAPSADQERLRTAYAAHLRAHPDGLARACRPDHLTASALVLAADARDPRRGAPRVLLMLHAKAQRWFQMGGHCEPGDLTLAGAAAREAAEESGIAGLAVDPVPIHLDAHEVDFCRGAGGASSSGHARHLDVRFLAVAPPGAVARSSAESDALEWFEPAEVARREPGLADLLAAARTRLAES